MHTRGGDLQGCHHGTCHPLPHSLPHGQVGAVVVVGPRNRGCHFNQWAPLGLACGGLDTRPSYGRLHTKQYTQQPGMAGRHSTHQQAGTAAGSQQASTAAARRHTTRQQSRHSSRQKAHNKHSTAQPVCSQLQHGNMQEVRAVAHRVKSCVTLRQPSGGRIDANLHEERWLAKTNSSRRNCRKLTQNFTRSPSGQKLFKVTLETKSLPHKRKQSRRPVSGSVNLGWWSNWHHHQPLPVMPTASAMPVMHAVPGACTLPLDERLQIQQGMNTCKRQMATLQRAVPVTHRNHRVLLHTCSSVHSRNKTRPVGQQT